jgi:hypothetical protein
MRLVSADTSQSSSIGIERPGERGRISYRQLGERAKASCPPGDVPPVDAHRTCPALPRWGPA